jgi:hypothetical protein
MGGVPQQQMTMGGGVNHHQQQGMGMGGGMAGDVQPQMNMRGMNATLAFAYFQQSEAEMARIEAERNIINRAESASARLRHAQFMSNFMYHQNKCAVIACTACLLVLWTYALRTLTACTHANACTLNMPHTCLTTLRLLHMRYANLPHGVMPLAN